MSSSKLPPGMQQTVVNGHTFTISQKFDLSSAKILGRGSYGVVTTAYDPDRNELIAIKRIRPYGNDEWDARHTLREIRLLKLLGPHPNIISLYDLSLFEDKTELYMMMELMDCDLHHIIQSKQSLSEMHHKCFAKQMMEGIKAMHSIGVFHRDLKPGNLLVSKDCRLRITDFGLARFMDDNTLQGNNSENPMTEYVVTRWYRCPELLLAPNRPYNEAIDLWSIGCIIAELIKRKPLFPGKSHANQVQLIFEVLGFSNLTELGFQVSSEASTFLTKKCKFSRQNLQDIIPGASADALALITGLLAVNPRRRPSAAQSLTYAYLRDAETLADYSVNYLSRPPEGYFAFESSKLSVDQLRTLIHSEVASGGRMAGSDVPHGSSTSNTNSSAAVSSSTQPTRRPSVNDDPAKAGAVEAPPSQAPTQLKGAGPVGFGAYGSSHTDRDTGIAATGSSSALVQSGGRVMMSNSASAFTVGATSAQSAASNAHEEFYKMKKSMTENTIASDSRVRRTTFPSEPGPPSSDEVDELVESVQRLKSGGGGGDDNADTSSAFNRLRSGGGSGGGSGGATGASSSSAVSKQVTSNGTGYAAQRFATSTNSAAGSSATTSTASTSARGSNFPRIQGWKSGGDGNGAGEGDDEQTVRAGARLPAGSRSTTGASASTVTSSKPMSTRRPDAASGKGPQ